LLPESEEYAQWYFADQHAWNEDYWKRFGFRPDVAGKRVLEVGCGHGAMAVDLARRGATVVGVDLDEGRIDFANRNLAARFPELANRVTFRSVDASALPHDEPFDILLSKDTLEHVEDVASQLRAWAELLKPGGLAYIGFSPLFYSPYGDHGRTGLKIPWVHAVLPRPVVRAAAARHNGRPRIGSLNDIGLNGNTPEEFRTAFADSGLTLLNIQYNKGDKKLLKVLDMVRARAPRFERFVTVSIYAVFKR
jgi:SAM-dependent methyltransferase